MVSSFIMATGLGSNNKRFKAAQPKSKLAMVGHWQQYPLFRWVGASDVEISEDKPQVGLANLELL
jgi:hypothetical protein